VNPNTFTGATTISSGILATSLNALASSASLTINGGSLALGSNGTTIINNLSGLAAGRIDSAFNIVSDGARTLQINQSADGTYAGSISQGSARAITLIKTGTARLTLGGASTHTGGTTLSQGTLVADNATALGTGGTVTINDATTGANNTTLLLGNVTMSRPVTVANQGSGTVTLGANGSVATPTFSGAITLSRDVTLDGSTNTDRFTFTGGIGGTGNVTIAGANRVVFNTTANTYAGDTSITANAILQLGLGGSTATQFIPNASVVTMGSGSFLKLAKGSNNETIGGLTGSGTVRGHEAVTSAASVLTIDNSANHSFAGILEDGGAVGSTLALTKSGAGAQTLSGTNTYTGATTVSAGTLLVNGSLAAGSAVTVQAAGTIGGSGTINGTTTIFGTHSPGNSPGVQTFGGNLGYDGATVVWELTGNTATQTVPAVFDQVIVGGNLEFTSATSLSLVFNQGSTVNWSNAFWNIDREWLLYDVSGTTSNFGNLSLNVQDWLDSSSNSFSTARPQAAFSLRQAEGGGDVFISYAVPEPGALVLAGCGFALAAWQMARRRRG
jgi:autotransporter-associated beta strand protein